MLVDRSLRPNANTLSSHRFTHTLAQPTTIHGIGFVSGADVRLTFEPAPPNTGYVFVRTDLPGQPEIPARTEFLLHNDRRTTLACGSAVVEMTEHVLAALAGLEIDDCRILLNAGELPAGDGSSMLFAEALKHAGIVKQPSLTDPIVITEPIAIADGKASIEIHPSEHNDLVIQYDLDYDNPGIGQQSYQARITPEEFFMEIAPARTFVLESEVAALKAVGIGKRHTARDLVVFSAQGKVIDNALRFPDECARHKVLDVLGDLALVGRPILGRVRAVRSGHRHNVALARQIMEKYSNKTCERKCGDM